jgi:ribosomal protein S18 acetylase RimI-like enzyme
LVCGGQNVLSKDSGELEIVDMDSHHIEDQVKIHMDAFRGYSNTKIGKNYVRKFLKWFANHHTAIALSALYEGKPAGYVVGAQVGYQVKMNKDLMGVAAIGFISHPWVIFNKKIISIASSRLKVLFVKKDINQSKEVPGKDNMVSLVGIAVSPSFSGYNIGSSLMNKFEELARLKGFSAMRLSVYDDNEAALRLYKKNGWQELSSNNKTITFIKVLDG